MRPLATIAVLTLTAFVASACGGVSLLSRGKSDEKTATAAAPPPPDPMARPIQVAWTSARAAKCGFHFFPKELRAKFLANEARAGASPEAMQKITRAYDFTLTRITADLREVENYCSKPTVDEIRADLQRHLAGDYTPRVRKPKTDDEGRPQLSTEKKLSPIDPSQVMQSQENF